LWTQELTELRKIYTAAARCTRRDGTGVHERDEAKGTYKKALIRENKKDWDDFLASAKNNDVWIAHQFTKIRVPNRVPGGQNSTPESTEQTIMLHICPPGDNPVGHTPARKHDLDPESNLEWIGEISEVLKKGNWRSAAGPDQVTYGVWKGIHSVNPKILPLLVKDMLTWGIHPPMLKESTGVILPKPNKPDYVDCASFRVIALRQTISKIVQRVGNNRLLTIAYAEGLYCINQTGSLLHRSTVDAAISLQHSIKGAQFAKTKVLLLFLDVKGGFDNIDHRKLLDGLSENNKVPDSLIDWIQNFITTRNISLAYPGRRRRTHVLNKGIPQGSPLSPLLFVIYVKPLHLAGEPTELFTTSYVDDFQLTVASNSWERNARRLEEKAAEMIAMAQSRGLFFSMAKTELMHWRKRCEKGARSESSVMVQSHVVNPAGSVVKWLGYSLADNGETATHFTKRLSRAQGAFW